MNWLLRIPLTALLLVGAQSPAQAWSFKGHELIGSVADQMLTPHAKREVKRLLQMDGLQLELQDAGPWADCAKSTVRAEDGSFKYTHHPIYAAPACIPFESPEGIRRIEDFVSRNWSACTYIESRPNTQCHETFHFSDVPISRTNYRDGDVGTNNHDVVHIVGDLIKVLQAPDVTSPDLKRAIAPLNVTSKQEALLLLVHYLGDLHQPLHVGVVFLAADGSRVDPAKPADVDPGTETSGANFIDDNDFINSFTGKPADLHTEWDAPPAHLGLTAQPDLMREARAVPPTRGAMADWPAQWAADTVRDAREAFAGVTFTPTGRARHWTAHFADRADYLKRKDAIQEKIIAKGGARLAQILNTIWP